MTTSGTKMRAMIHMAASFELGGLNVLSLGRSRGATQRFMQLYDPFDFLGMNL